MAETTTVGVLRERAPNEHRVALVPDVVARLRSAGLEGVVETHAGAGPWFDDGAYAAAGATVVSRPEVYERADVVVCVEAPGDAVAGLRPGQALAGLLGAAAGALAGGGGRPEERK